MDLTREEARQGEVLAFLERALGHGTNKPARRIDTHGAIVFLAGNDAYKIKRAVLYPYMDFSTLAKRKAACEAEIAVNRRHAPGIYLGVIPITRSNGCLALGGTGPIVEWVVHMRRFDETATLDQLSARHEITSPLIDRLTRTVLDSHQQALVCPSADIISQTEKVITQTVSELKRRSGAAQMDAVSRFADTLHKTFMTARTALSGRARGGYVRRCHGDLHLRNIAMIDGGPVLFDAIEFDDAIATIDILYDLAFLVMDLLHRGSRVFACRLLNRYLWASASQRDDIAGLSLLPLYLALRAGIRAAVLSEQAGLTGKTDLLAEISAYLQEALSYLEPEPAGIIAIGGLSGSGKSTISDALAPTVGAAPGAIQLRSDIERKRRFGVEPMTHLGQDAYRENVSDAVYASLFQLADLAVHAGRTVILDATFLDEKRRIEALALTSRNGVPFHGLWLKADAALLKSRLEARGEDASDATVAVMQSQLREDVGAMDWHVIEASLPMEDIIREIRRIVAIPNG